MKLAISTLGCPNWTFQQVLENFHAYGVQGIEVRGIDGKMEADDITWFAPDKQAETKALLKQYGLKIIGFGSSFSFHDAVKVAQVIEKAKKTIDILERMEIPAMRVFGNNIPDPTKKAETVKRVADGICEVAAYGHQHGVDVNLEVHGDFNTADTLGPIVEAFKQTPGAGILWDIEHSDKTYGDNFMEFYAMIKPLLKHMHIKDYMRKKADGAKDWTLVKVGDGEIPIVPILKQVIADGYDGYFSFEWEKKWHPEIDEPEIAFPHFVKKMHEWIG